MILTFDVPPQGRGQGLCDIDSPVYSPEKIRKIFEKWEVLVRRN